MNEKCYKCEREIDLSNKKMCDKCGKNITYVWVHHIDCKYLFCKSCYKMIADEISLVVEQYCQKFIQPERLNPETPKGDAIV